MVKICDILNEGIEILSDKCENVRFEAELLLAACLKKDRIYIAVHINDSVEKDIYTSFISQCKRRADGEPSAYITGSKEFMGLEFCVNPSVLIPRPETELIVEHIISRYQDRPVSIIDICTGSGAIACSLAYYLPRAKITATDISSEALNTARINAEKLGVSDRVSFTLHDALGNFEFGKSFDLAVSNPPYIRSDVIETLETNVKNYEPHIALDGGNDGLIFYRNIVDNIESLIISGGELVFEIGCDQGEDLRKIMSSKFKDIQITKDYAGLDRLASGILKQTLQPLC